MQSANCLVQLLNSNGPHKNEAFKTGVTPAEVVILRSIHGADAVNGFSRVVMDKREHRAELDRLRRRYGAATVDRVFPGHSPQLPVRFSDIGIDVNADEAGDEQEDAKAEAPRRGRRKKSEADTLVVDGPYDPVIDGE
jgi:Mg-chelatase subunit ChlI